MVINNHEHMISLRSKNTQKILNYFFINPEAKSYINEIAKLLNLDPKNTDRKLKELEKEGLLKSTFMGKQRYFILNNQYPLLRQYKEIFLKTLGIEIQIKNLIKENKDIKEGYIFGSYAKNKMDSNSDIDILLIGNHSSIKTKKEFYSLEKDINREINIINLSPSEIKRKENDPFIKNIFSDKIIKIK